MSNVKNLIRGARRFLPFSPAEPEMLFVCGCGHSGTTLLATMLGSNRRVYCIPEETWLFGQPSCDNHEVEKQLRAKYNDHIAGNRISYVCEKSPGHVHWLSRIRRSFPRARFLFAVRDPRDVALSIKLRTGDLRAGYVRWIRDNTALRQEEENPTGSSFTCRYEALIDNPSLMLQQICSWLNLRYDRNMLNFHKDSRPWFGLKENAVDEPAPSQHEEFRNWQVKQPLMDRRGRWRQMLTPSEICEIETSCKELMSHFEYELSENTISFYATGASD